jgi:hypothetical protein
MGIQTASERKRFARLRQSLRKLARDVSFSIEPFVSDKPVIKGSIYELKRKCGKPECTCTRGQLHARMVLSASEKGRTKLRVIPRGFLIEVQDKVRRYRTLRQARARMIKVHKRILQIMDEIEAMRREEMK